MVQVKKIQLKNAILKAARREFVEKGFQGANLRAITKNAGCSLSNLYNYFDNKDDLFSTVLRPRMDEIKKGLEIIKTIHPPAGSYMTSLKEERKYHITVVDYIDEHREDLKLIFLKCQGSSVEGFSEFVIDEYQQMWNRWVAYVKDTFPKKVTHKISDFFIHTISSSYLNSVMEFLSHDVPREDMLLFTEEMLLYSYYGFVGLLDH